MMQSTGNPALDKAAEHLQELLRALNQGETPDATPRLEGIMIRPHSRESHQETLQTLTSTSSHSANSSAVFSVIEQSHTPILEEESAPVVQEELCASASGASRSVTASRFREVLAVLFRAEAGQDVDTDADVQTSCAELRGNLTEIADRLAALFDAFHGATAAEDLRTPGLLADARRRLECDPEHVDALRAKLDDKDKQISQLQALLKDAAQAQNERADLDSTQNSSGVLDSADELNKEIQRLKQELSKKEQVLNMVESQTEKEAEDIGEFFRHLASTSAASMLNHRIDLGTLEILGRGNWGYVFLSRETSTGKRVVIKAQSHRKVMAVAKEWAHATELGSHPHIVPHGDAVLHRDSVGHISKQVAAGFDSGLLAGKRPTSLPECWLCMMLEYMDHGTVQHLIDLGVLTTNCIAAITSQVASALGYMHQRHRTHNDVKPENLLLQMDPSRNHLVAKLADFGLAEHSMSRQQDLDMFAYTVWCMGLRRPFQRCPRGEERTMALQAWVSGPRAGHDFSGEAWDALATAIAGLWEGRVGPRDVAHDEVLRGRRIRIPAPVHAAPIEANAMEASRRLCCAERRWRTAGSMLTALARLGSPNASRPASSTTMARSEDTSILEDMACSSSSVEHVLAN